MKRVIAILMLIIFTFTGCVPMPSGNINVLKSPKNNKLLIKGTWQDDSDQEEKIYFDLDSAFIKGHKYSKVNYKLKIVKSDYTISYEHDIKVSDYISEDKTTDVYSIFTEDKLICELFLFDEDYAILSYNQEIINIKRVSKDIDKSIESSSKDDNTSNENIDDDSTGVMIALKSENGDSQSYRTLWIPYYNKQLGDIYELPDITFPRRDGIYKIQTNVSNINNDEFKLITPDKKNISSSMDSGNLILDRSITFICNDYIGIEERSLDYDKNEITKLKVLPVINLNSNYGVSIQELYGYYITDEFNNQIYKEYELYSEDDVSIALNIDYTNFTLYRERGKWNIYSLIDTTEGEKLAQLQIKPNHKLLTYDTLTIPWKNLKAEFPLMKDAFISPTEDIAIIVLQDSIGIYRIVDSEIDSSPLFNIPIGKNEEVIMAEWSSGVYTRAWEYSFLSGKLIN